MVNFINKTYQIGNVTESVTGNVTDEILQSQDKQDDFEDYLQENIAFEVKTQDKNSRFEILKEFLPADQEKLFKNFD